MARPLLSHTRCALAWQVRPLDESERAEALQLWARDWSRAVSDADDADARGFTAATWPPPPPPPPPVWLHETSATTQLFGGQLVSTVSCRDCGHVSRTIERCLDLSLPIPSAPDASAAPSSRGPPDADDGPPRKARRLEDTIRSWLPAWSSRPSPPAAIPGASDRTPRRRADCLRGYFASERLVGDERYDCPTCRKRCDGVRAARLLSLPPNLVLHLNRFDASQSSDAHVAERDAEKRRGHVEFPLTLDVAEWCAGVVDGHVDGARLGHVDGGVVDGHVAHLGPTAYDLCAVVVHKGESTTGGHYRAYVRVPPADAPGGGAATWNSRWYLADDGTVTELGSASEVLSAEAYLLFYARRPSDALIARRTVVTRALAPPPRAAPALAPPPSPPVLLPAAWLVAWAWREQPTAPSYGGVTCEHGAVAGDLAAARDACVRVPVSAYALLCELAGADADGSSALRQFTRCAECEARASRLRARRESERSEIAQLDATELGHAEVWMLVCARWLRHWTEFAHDATRTDPPGALDNSRLLEASRSRALPHLRKAIDYRGVNTAVWNALLRRYGGGPAICRGSINLYAEEAPLPAGASSGCTEADV